MSDFTFLDIDWSIELLSKINSAEITDYSICLGGYYTEEKYENNPQGLKIGRYWTRNYSNEYTGYAIVEDEDSIMKEEYKHIDVNARPVINSCTLKNEGSIEVPVGNNVLEVEYGYYPQKVANKKMQALLNTGFKKGELQETKNKYTSYDSGCDKYIPHQEYILRGKNYICVRGKMNDIDDKILLSDGQEYNDGDTVWVEVQPVKWLVFKEAGIMMSEKLLFSGVPFNTKIDKENFSFETSDIKKYMDIYFSKELIQPRDKSINKNVKRNNNPHNFKFNEVSEQDIIKSAIESNVSVFLHGKPGCGKSDRVKQLDPDFIELNLSHLDPELLDGLAGEKDGKAVHIKPLWLEELEEKCGEEPDKIHILFLEELTNASQMMQSKAYGIALDKKVAGRWNLPENARVVAAGNELEDSLVANEIAEPLYDRFTHVNIETTAESWLEWAVTPENTYERLDYKKDKEPRQKIHPAIYSYISCRGEKALRTPYNREHPQPHADPRRWKMASDMLYASNNPTTLRAIVGEELTRDFTAFCKRATLSIQDVINENYKEEDIAAMDMDEQLATLAGLVPVDERDMTKIRNFVKKLGPEMCGKFDAQWAGNNEERLEQIQEERMRENQINLKLHDGEEAKADVNYGILSAKKINAEYQMYLSKEENKGTETQEK